MELQINILARAKLPSQYGNFEIVSFEKGGVNLDHVAVIRGKLDGASKVPTRLHSECLTGDVFHSCRCDCRQQLEYALMHFALLERSLILYMRQEGRGIGIANKVAAYSLQDKGMDTVEANHHLGFDDDMRTYDEAAGMLKALGIKSIELYTNNPQKIDGLRKLGIEVTSRSPIVIPPNGVNDFYLKTKQQKSGHMLNIV